MHKNHIYTFFIVIYSAAGPAFTLLADRPTGRVLLHAKKPAPDRYRIPFLYPRCAFQEQKEKSCTDAPHALHLPGIPGRFRRTFLTGTVRRRNCISRGRPSGVDRISSMHHQTEKDRTSRLSEVSDAASPDVPG